MTRRVKLNHVHELLTELSYPVDNETASSQLDDVTLVYADGEESLHAVLERSNEDEHHTAEDLESEIYSNLPVEAVGEPGQAEGEG